MGLDVYLIRKTEDGKEESVEEASSLYPDHLFKVGYFRSSYNEAGLDSVLQAAIGVTLYSIFAREIGEYEVRPDWRAALAATEIALGALDGFVDQTGGIRVMSEDISLEATGPGNASGALTLFRAQQDRRKEQGQTGADCYSTGGGTFFFGEPVKLLAIIQGKTFGRFPVHYLVYDGSDSYDWYRQALEIVRETIQYVIARPDPEKYLLHWSG